MVAWGGSTSTPADKRTREKRIEAHDAFDRTWKSGARKRTDAYKALAAFMGLAPNNCHIGMFDIEQCEKVIEFATVTEM